MNNNIRFTIAVVILLFGYPTAIFFNTDRPLLYAGFLAVCYMLATKNE